MPEITIDKLAYGGAGFGRIDGKACFVPLTAPGDRALIKIEKNSKSYSEGIVEEIISKSDMRVSPECPYFGRCGGCNWQHIKYEEQCRQKEHILVDSLWRGARVEKEKVKSLIPSPVQFEYRQRIQLKANFDYNKLHLGFNKRNSHSVVDIGDKCLIAGAPLNAAIKHIREIISTYSEPSHIPQVDLSSSSDGSVSANFHFTGRSLAKFFDHILASQLIGNKLQSINLKGVNHSLNQYHAGLDLLKYNVSSSLKKDLDLYYPSDGFSQVNFAQNNQLIQLLLDICNAIPSDSILDLYCGNGNFSLPLAGIATSIVGYEYFKKSVDTANHNSLINSIGNANYVQMDSDSAVSAIIAENKSFDLVILDPPRAGAESVVRKLYKTKAMHLIYISCDPMTLSRDISLLKLSGYQVVYVQPIDMFPQTYHLETLVLLRAT